MDSSHNYYCGNTTNMTNQLDELEKYLFSLGQEVSVQEMNQYNVTVGMINMVDFVVFYVVVCR